MTTSTLTKNQVKTFSKHFVEDGRNYLIIAKVRFDDDCGNGHNSFCITGEIWEATTQGNRTGIDSISGGRLDEDIAKHFPHLAKYQKWNLCSTDGPMHYVANTVYHAEQGKLDYARSTAIWLDASIEDLKDKANLLDRLPQLLAEFEVDMIELGFKY